MNIYNRDQKNQKIAQPWFLCNYRDIVSLCLDCTQSLRMGIPKTKTRKLEKILSFIILGQYSDRISLKLLFTVGYKSIPNNAYNVIINNTT